ncbi:MAG: ATP-binding protein [Oscillospiraceae bacterium]|nr:ATP-binding protein [Oscillospiraceae bacterium]
MHFILSSVLIVVLLLTIPVVTLYLLSSTYDEQVRHGTQRITSSISHTIHTFINGAYSMVNEIADNPAVLSFNPVVQTQILENVVMRNPYIDLIYITDSNGKQTARSSGELGDSSERWWFQDMMELQQPLVTQSHYSLATGMPCTTILFPMFNYGLIIGVVVVDINLEYLQSLIEQFTDIESGQYAFILDGEGVVIAHHDNYILTTLTNYKTNTRTVPMWGFDGKPLTHPDGSIMTVRENLTTSEDFHAIINSVMDGNTGLEIAEYGDNMYYIGFEPVDLPGFSDSWSILTLHDRDIAMSVISTLLTQEIVVVSIILAVFVILIFTLFSSLSRTMDFLENARSEAVHANNAKSNFLATMSHEIRTPLNAILGLTQVQLQNDVLPKDCYESLEKIYTSGNNLLKIINDILDLSKVETGILDLNPETYSIPGMLNDTVKLNIVRIGDKKLDFILKVDQNIPSKVLGDSLRVKQILNNLLSNAIKYATEGHVKLSVSHSVNGDDVLLCFKVEDTGVGISPEDQQKLFDEYARFNIQDSAFIEGTGLGLAITKRLAEMMGGDISVQSVKGEGSEFTATIAQKVVKCEPIGADTAEQLENFTYSDDTNALTQLEYADLSHGNVLIVDDIEINLFVAEAVLAPYNLNIDMVSSGAAAIEKIEGGKVYDIIFMDHMMPDMDGLETTQNLRDMGYKGTVLALTANALVGNEEMFTDRGFDGFLSKPIDIHELDAVVTKYVK